MAPTEEPTTSATRSPLRRYSLRVAIGLVALVTVANLTSYCTRDGALVVFHYPLFGFAVITGESGGIGFYREPVDVVRIESLPFHGTFANLCAEAVVFVHFPRFIAASTN